MSDDGSLHWKKIFLQAMDESDTKKLRRLVPKAEAAIFLRRKELGNSADWNEELSTMAVATEALRCIRVTQLGGVKPRASIVGRRRVESAESS
jgi:hypothetical protein